MEVKTLTLDEIQQEMEAIEAQYPDYDSCPRPLIDRHSALLLEKANRPWQERAAFELRLELTRAGIAA